MKNLQYIFCRKPVYMGLVFSICILRAGAQPVSPTSNIPNTETIFQASYLYPGLANMTNPSGKYNYVRTILPDQPVQSLSGAYYKRQTTDYFDGLGRPLQTVAKKGHADGNDLVTVRVYDNLGRETYQYLPYAAPTGGILVAGAVSGGMKLNVNAQMRGFYDEAGSDEPPFSKTVFDNSPLNRVTKQMAPGKAWVTSDRGITYDYKTNNVWQYYFVSLRNIWNAYPIWVITDAANAIPQVQGYYNPGTLSITIVTDEDGKVSREVKDKAGRVVMKMQQYTTVTSNLHPTDFAYTFYVYDALGRLRCVIPPEAAKPKLSTSGNDIGWGIKWDVPLQQQMDGLCYQYFYDERSRLVEKKIPGKKVEYYVYDKRDRLVLSQDGNLRNQGNWLFTIYDALDRPTVTSLLETGSSVSRQTLVDIIYTYPTTTSTLNSWYYVMNYNLYNVYPTYMGSCKILSYTYYDDYTQGGLSAFPYDYNQFNGITGINDRVVAPSPNASTMTRGLPTGSKVRVMDPDNPNADNWLTSVNYYDDKGRLIQSQSRNLAGGTDISSNIYFFQGTLFKNILRHRNPGALEVPGTTDGAITEYRLQNTFQRNFGLNGGNDMVWSHRQKVTKVAGTVVNEGLDYELAYYDYDHLGRNVLKQFTAGANRQDYNMRGFLTRIGFWEYSNSDTLFNENLYYDNGFKSKLYNGNIAGITWCGKDRSKYRSYGYSYDNLNRLTHAEFRQKAGSSWSNNTYDYTASGITYDLNGNIKSMNQMVTPVIGGNGKMPMDQLTYTYAPNSNKLIKVEDVVPADDTRMLELPDFKDDAHLGEEYHYDENGNMETDENKRITSITYNYLNKPEVITVGSNSTITYVYDAAGNRLQKKVLSPDDGIDEKWDYIGNFVYKNDVLQYILNEEGRARPVPGNTADYIDPNLPQESHPTKFIYDYFIKDHLGNVRSTVTANPRTFQYLASHAIAMANTEELIFDHIPDVREVKPGTVGNEDIYAARLNGGESDKRVGTAIMLHTRPGDKLNISVKAFYDGEYRQGDETGAGDLVESLTGALLGGNSFEGVPIGELPENAQLIQEIFGNASLASQIADLTATSNNTDAPKAHLNYLWFNDEMQLDAAHSGSFQVVQNVNGTGGWVTIGTNGGGNVNPGQSTGGGSVGVTGDDVLVAPGNGFLIVYIDNQSIGKDVWFDDLAVQHYESEVLEEDHYYPFGLTLNMTPNTLPQGQPYKLTTKELESNFDLNIYDFGARMQDMQLGRWWQIDPLTEKIPNMNPYNYVSNNPVNRIDPTGTTDDWVQEADGDIKWDKNANSQATTSTGETYLGKTLTFRFNSYIDPKLWDGPMGSLPAGDKLTSTITLTGNENSQGDLTSLSATKSVQLGETPVGNARDYFSGLGNDQNKFSLAKGANGTSLNFEQHASVSPSEQLGLNSMGFSIVNVAQKLNLNVSNNKLSISASTDVFPSATLSVNGKELFKYNQPSFVKTHGQRNATAVELQSMPRDASRVISLRPQPAFHLRFQTNN